MSVKIHIFCCINITISAYNYWVLQDHGRDIKEHTKYAQITFLKFAKHLKSKTYLAPGSKKGIVDLHLFVILSSLHEGASSYSLLYALSLELCLAQNKYS